MGGFVGSVAVEIDGFQSLQYGRRSSEGLRMCVCMGVFWAAVFLVGKARSNGNSGYREVEDDEEDSGSEPAGEECPERRRG